jgi:type I restriction enzyme R subunit
MQLSEADTKAKLVDPVLHSRGWTEDLIRREETAPAIDIVNGEWTLVCLVHNIRKICA